MTRTALLLSTILAAFPARAADFVVAAPVVAATVYQNGAVVTRQFDIDVPQGTHRLLLPATQQDARLEGLGSITVEQVELLPGYLLDVEQLYSPAQQAAKAAVEKAEQAVEDATDDIARASAELAGAKARIKFLRSISAGSAEALDAEALLRVGEMVASELAASFLVVQDAEEALRPLQEALEDAEDALKAAERDFALLSPPQAPLDMRAFTITAAEPVTTTLEIREFKGATYWRPAYEIDLDRDDGRVSIERQVLLEQNTGEAWTDVALTLSTLDASGQSVPSHVRPNLARLISEKREAVFSSQQLRRSTAALADQELAVVDPIVEEVPFVQFKGLSVTYAYPKPVSIASGDGILTLSLDHLEFAAETFNRAAPRFDKTAFLMARFTNTYAEPILEGEAAFYVEGDLIARRALPRIPAGAEVEQAFGALEGLRLDYKLLDNDTGDRGLLTTSNTRTQQIEFSVENLTAKEEQVETLFALPFSEQEDLNVRVQVRPAPDETDFDQARQVAKWDLALAPGQKQTVRMTVGLSWPEDQQLLWQP